MKKKNKHFHHYYLPKEAEESEKAPVVQAEVRLWEGGREGRREGRRKCTSHSHAKFSTSLPPSLPPYLPSGTPPQARHVPTSWTQPCDYKKTVS